MLDPAWRSHCSSPDLVWIVMKALNVVIFVFSLSLVIIILACFTHPSLQVYPDRARTALHPPLLIVWACRRPQPPPTPRPLTAADTGQQQSIKPPAKPRRYVPAKTNEQTNQIWVNISSNLHRHGLRLESCCTVHQHSFESAAGNHSHAEVQYNAMIPSVRSIHIK